MLTNFDLEELSIHYHVPLIDICMKDQLPKIPRNGNYIINLQSSTEGNGTHFTALKIQDDKAFFYDPFGAPPSIEIRDFIKLSKKIKHFAFNNWIIQDLHSSNCGYFCFSFLLYVNPKDLWGSANEYMNRFVEDTRRNDEILKESFRNLPVEPHRFIKRLFRIKSLLPKSYSR
jgi:hypothetical protein